MKLGRAVRATTTTTTSFAAADRVRRAEQHTAAAACSGEHVSNRMMLDRIFQPKKTAG
jgi:hypothetical protein